jgi:polar amino acid transport system permease protein
MYHWDFRVVWLYKEAFFNGLLVTLGLTALVCIFGTILGLFLALGRLARSGVVKALSIAYIEVFLALPLLVLLLWMYHALTFVSPVLRLSGFQAALLAMTLNLAPFIAETIRAGIESIPRGQGEAALSVGMSYSQMLRRIILPQAIRRVTPPLLTQYITMLKLSPLASFIAVAELLKSANDVILTTYRPMEIYTAVAVIYLIIILPLTLGTRLLERRYVIRT